jgi:hypothetical protein
MSWNFGKYMFMVSGFFSGWYFKASFLNLYRQHRVRLGRRKRADLRSVDLKIVGIAAEVKYLEIILVHRHI